MDITRPTGTQKNFTWSNNLKSDTGYRNGVMNWQFNNRCTSKTRMYTLNTRINKR